MSRGRRIAAPSSTGRSPDDEPLAADEPLAPDDSGVVEAEPVRLPDDDAEAAPDFIQRGLEAIQDRRRVGSALLAVLLLIVAIYVLFPKVVGFKGTLASIADATWYWIVVAIAFNLAAFAAYVALFRGVLGGSSDPQLRRRLDVRASYQITMAGLAATRIFSAAGAGGVALTYWALRKAGLGRRASASRMVAFLALLYAVYLAALVLFGVLLRVGVLPGDNPVGGTIVPAALAGATLAVIGLIALIPEDVERRLAAYATRHGRLSRIAARLVRGPATVADGVRFTVGYVAHPSRGALALAGAVTFWAANIGILWASFEAFGGDVPVAVLVQGFFVGMTANLLPSPAGGAGPVDAGMIAAFLLFGMPEAVVFPAVLSYRVIAFWLPIPPGVVAYVQLRRTVAGWQPDPEPAGGYTIKSKVPAEAR